MASDECSRNPAAQWNRPVAPEPTTRALRPCGMRLLRIIAVTVITGGSFLVMPVQPAAATSCAMQPAMTAHALVTGTEPREPGAPAFLADVQRYGLIGTVVDVRTDTAPATYGRTEVDFRVDAVLGDAADQTDLGTITVHQSDPGWMNGYPFESGRRYLVPVTRAASDWLPAGSSLVCDPIRPVRDAAHATRLIGAAEASGVVPVTVPGDAQQSDHDDAVGNPEAPAATISTDGEGPGSTEGGDVTGMVIGVGTAGAAGVVAVLLARRWRRGGYGHRHVPGPA